MVRRRAALLFAAAFLLRVIAAVWAPGHWFAYSLYLQMAGNVAHGVGFCLYPNATYCAYFPPVYPAALVPGVWLSQPHAWVVMLGSTAGAATCVLTYLLGRRLFSEGVGLVAGAYAAIYPYFVWHDSVLQETALLTCVVLAAMYALTGERPGLGAGVLLASAVLTKATLALFAMLAVGWVFWRHGWRRGLLVALSLGLLVGGWMLRTWRVTGSPMLYSNTGFAWWTIHHPRAFEVFPQRSIDDVTLTQWGDLDDVDRRALDQLQDAHGIARSRWFWQKGWEFIASDPARALRQAVEKIWIAFSPVFSPAKGTAFEILYAVMYAPLSLLTPLGIWWTRQRWRDLLPLYLLLGAFAISCALFWGHTSHRMLVEPYLMLFASVVIVRIRKGDNTPSGIV